MYKYFNEIDFKSCNPSCSINDMNPLLLTKLDLLREMLGKPIILNSAYRTVEYEKTKNRSGSSAHTSGMAVDIRCTSANYRFDVVNFAIAVGFNRIGIADTFVHLDISNDDKHAKNVIWTY